MGDVRIALRAEFDLPSSWQYMQAVLPHLGIAETAGPVRRAPHLIHEGLKLLDELSEPDVFAMAWENTFDAKSGLRLSVPNFLWVHGDTVRARFSDEARSAGRDEWTTRRVLVCALLVEARRRDNNWDLGEHAQRGSNRQPKKPTGGEV